MITKKLLTDDLKFSRSSGKIHLKYKGKQLAVLAEGVLFQLLLDAAPMSFIHDLGKVAGVTTKNVAPKNVVTLATVYVYKKLLHLNKKPNSMSDPMVLSFVDKLLADKKAIADFMKATQTMKEAGITDCIQFVEAQVAGLQFVNNGEGRFPTVHQLATPAAYDRTVEFTATNSESKPSDKKTAKPKSYWFFNKEVDGSLTLETNQKFKTAIANIKKGVVSIDEAVYAQKFFSYRRNGRSYSIIEEYIEKISH